ncbi:MAG TPA: hypothetical protein VF741_08030 [Candidatus Aquilonibacter sp.]
MQTLPIDANMRVLARDVPVEGDTRLRNRVVAADSDFAIERPTFSIEWSAEDLEQVHGGEPFSGAAARLLVAGVSCVKGPLNKTAHPDDSERVTMNRIDELLELIEVEPDALREAEFLQVQAILETLVGKSITAAEVQDTRIVITTADGNRYYFYGFLGSGNTAT